MTDYESLFARLEAEFGVTREAADHWGLTVVAKPEALHAVVQFLRDEAEPKFDVLNDVVGIDYLGFKDYEGPRFAVEYLFRTIAAPVARMRVKVYVSEDALEVPTVSDLYASADWAEREVFDQYGIVFKGHHDLRRILNHVEFVGHPLRKDYPAHRRQWLSTSDFLLPELETRLESKGYRIIQRSEEIMPNDEEYLEGSRKK